jgi:signal transduction histidine kinase/ActR/RegA family two-component response regulator
MPVAPQGSALNCGLMTTAVRRANDYLVLILPPTRRDGEVTRTVLERAGLECTVYAGTAALAEQIGAGTGAIVLTDALAGDPGASEVVAALRLQPAWSDVPTILLSRADGQSAAATRLLACLTNVTVLDRPTSPRTLVSSVQAAIRGRARQYQIRDQLDALRAAEDALRNADRRKDEFLAMLAHELRNPLAPIRTASELLARLLPPDAKTQAIVAVLKRQAIHLTRLVDDLLDVSRITQGRIQLQRRPLALAPILAQAMESVESLLRDKRHKVVLTSCFEPLFVNGDSARLVQCIANLLTNAAKYTDSSGEIRIELRSEQSSAVIVVSDNGVGISQELLPRIFELFVQSERSLDRSEGGLGIGLSVVQRLVEMHDGTVAAASAGPGRGSTFEIRLPTVAAPKEGRKKSTSRSAAPKRVLVVDDNVDAASSLAAFLQLDGHQAEAVYSAKGALEAIASFGPDVVLLDIGLPEMDGYEVAKRIRAGGSGVRLVALTGYGQAEDIERTHSAGFDAHLVKPVDFGALERTLSGKDVVPRPLTPVLHQA